MVTPSVNPRWNSRHVGSAGAPAFTPGAAAAGQVFVPMPPPSEEAFQPPAMTRCRHPKADGGKLGTWSVFFMILLVTTAVGLGRLADRSCRLDHGRGLRRDVLLGAVLVTTPTSPPR